MIRFKTRGDFKKTRKFLKNLDEKDWYSILNLYGEYGVAALASNTPVDTGKTSQSWSYTVEKRRDGYTIHWKNSNVQNGANIALLIQYGHGTRNGGYVQGLDYINPAIRPVFREMVGDIWEEVQNS